MKQTEIEVSVIEQSVIELTQAQAAKGGRGVIELTQSITQAVKVFRGIMGNYVQVDKKGKQVTVAEWFESQGVELKRDKNGRNPQLTVANLLQAWGFKDEQGKPQIYRNVPGGIPDEETIATGKLATRAYVKTDDDYAPVSVLQLQTISKWNAATIIRGLIQNHFADAYAKKAAKSVAAWLKADKAYAITRHRNSADEVRELDKERVSFDGKTYKKEETAQAETEQSEQKAA